MPSHGVGRCPAIPGLPSSYGTGVGGCPAIPGLQSPYGTGVARLGLTPYQFEERVRDDLKIEQLSAEVVPDSPDRRAVVDWKQALIDAAEVERHPIP